MIRRAYSREWFRGFQAAIDYANIGAGPYTNQLTQIARESWSQPDGSEINNGSGYSGYLIDCDSYFFSSSAAFTPGVIEYPILKHGQPIRQEEAYCIDAILRTTVQINADPTTTVYGPGIIYSAEWLDSGNNVPGDCWMATLSTPNASYEGLYLNLYKHIYVAVPGTWTWVYSGQVQLENGSEWIESMLAGDPQLSLSLRLVHNYVTPKVPGIPLNTSLQDKHEVWYSRGRDINAVQFIDNCTPAYIETSDLDISGVTCLEDGHLLGLKDGEPRYYCGVMLDEYSCNYNASVFHLSQSSYWDYTARGLMLLERVAPFYSANGIMYVTPGDMWGVPVWRTNDEIETWVQENRVGRRLGKDEAESDNPYLTLYHSGRLGKVDHTLAKGDYDTIVVRDTVSAMRNKTFSGLGSDAYPTYSVGDPLQLLFIQAALEGADSDFKGQPGRTPHWPYNMLAFVTKDRADDWTAMLGNRAYLGVSLGELASRCALELGCYLVGMPEGYMFMSDEPRDMNDVLIAPFTTATNATPQAMYLGSREVEGGFTFYNLIEVYGDQSNATPVYAVARNQTSIDKYGVIAVDPPYVDPNIETVAEAQAIASRILSTYNPSTIRGGLSELRAWDVYSYGWADIRAGDNASAVLPEYGIGLGPSKSGNASDWEPMQVFVTERALTWMPDGLYYLRHRIVNCSEWTRLIDAQSPEEYQMSQIKYELTQDRTNLLSHKI